MSQPVLSLDFVDVDFDLDILSDEESPSPGTSLGDHGANYNSAHAMGGGGERWGVVARRSNDGRSADGMRSVDGVRRSVDGRREEGRREGGRREVQVEVEEVDKTPRPRQLGATGATEYLSAGTRSNAQHGQDPRRRTTSQTRAVVNGITNTNTTTDTRTNTQTNDKMPTQTNAKTPTPRAASSLLSPPTSSNRADGEAEGRGSRRGSSTAGGAVKGKDEENGNNGIISGGEYAFYTLRCCWFSFPFLLCLGFGSFPRIPFFTAAFAFAFGRVGRIYRVGVVQARRLGASSSA